MRRVVATFFMVVLVLPSLLQAQQVTGPGISTFSTTQLPTPLVLPPGLTEYLPIVKDASYFGDAVKVVDCDPQSTTTPLGLCNNNLFGGLALMSSHLQGFIQITFHTPINNISHF